MKSPKTIGKQVKRHGSAQGGIQRMTKEFCTLLDPGPGQRVIGERLGEHAWISSKRLHKLKHVGRSSTNVAKEPGELQLRGAP